MPPRAPWAHWRSWADATPLAARQMHSNALVFVVTFVAHFPVPPLLAYLDAPLIVVVRAFSSSNGLLSDYELSFLLVIEGKVDRKDKDYSQIMRRAHVVDSNRQCAQACENEMKGIAILT